MRQLVLAALAAASLAAGPALARQPAALPAAIATDPPADAAHPARSEVLHIPSAGVEINGLAYIPAGAGPHPTLVLLHGLPGNEKNLDLAQAVRRAGWMVVTFNYRGSWGSPGKFSFAGNIDDAGAVAAYLRDPANARRLGLDPARIAIAGHSMGGWAAAHAFARDPALKGLIMISAADMGLLGLAPPQQRTELMKGNMETLAGVTPQSMADEVGKNAKAFSLASAAPTLLGRPVLILSSDDDLAPHVAPLAKTLAGPNLTTAHVATDHAWNTARVRLQAEVIGWLEKVR